MILQFKGYKNNWCYEEAEIITFSTIYLGDIIDNCMHNTKEEDVNFYKYLDTAISEYIKEEIHCEEPKFIIGDTKLDDLTNVYVVHLSGENKNITYVFTKGVYLLNNSGKTIQKIC